MIPSGLSLLPVYLGADISLVPRAKVESLPVEVASVATRLDDPAPSNQRESFSYLTCIALFSLMVKQSRGQVSRIDTVAAMSTYFRSSPLYIRMAMAGTFTMAKQGPVARSEHESELVRSSCFQNEVLYEQEKD